MREAGAGSGRAGTATASPVLPLAPGPGSPGGGRCRPVFDQVRDGFRTD
ncbi:hypothetical protein [Streptomyces venetus]